MGSVFSGIRVLVVDDFSTMRKIAKNIFHQIGIVNVDEADDGTTGLGMLKKNKYDIALVDWSMPKMDGLALLKAMRSEPNLAKIPVIMVVAQDLTSGAVEMAKAGLVDSIKKPFTAAALEEKLNHLLIYGSTPSAPRSAVVAEEEIEIAEPNIYTNLDKDKFQFLLELMGHILQNPPTGMERNNLVKLDSVARKFARAYGIISKGVYREICCSVGKTRAIKSADEIARITADDFIVLSHLVVYFEKADPLVDPEGHSLGSYFVDKLAKPGYCICEKPHQFGREMVFSITP